MNSNPEKRPLRRRRRLRSCICRALAQVPLSPHTQPRHSRQQPRSSGGARGSWVLALLGTPHPKRGHRRRAAAGRCCKSTSAAAAGPKQPPGSLQNPRVQAGLTTTIPEVSQPWRLEEGPGSCRPQVTRGKTQMGFRAAGEGRASPGALQGARDPCEEHPCPTGCWEQPEVVGKCRVRAGDVQPGQERSDAASSPGSFERCRVSCAFEGVQLGRSRTTLPVLLPLQTTSP